jgi:hypothetical protein
VHMYLSSMISFPWSFDEVVHNPSRVTHIFWWDESCVVARPQTPETECLIARLSIPFRSARNGRNIPYQFKKRNKTEQISSHFKSRSVPDFSAKFRPKRSGSIPHVPFHSGKTIESNWTLFNLIN